VVNIDESSVKFAFSVTRGSGIDGKRDGVTRKNVLASYNHLHALSTPEWAAALVARAGSTEPPNRKQPKRGQALLCDFPESHKVKPDPFFFAYKRSFVERII
jgi:Cobyrinic acid a,c-diamide synthase